MITHCGYIAIVGRPNVGKSTLLNKILKQKVSITSRKAQTTRHTILGIQTEESHQYIYVDTPGIHLHAKKMMNKMMNKSATSVLSDVDLILFVCDALRWTDDDEQVLSLIKRVDKPCYLILNKVDTFKDKSQLLPCLEEMSKKHAFTGMIPISAKTGDQLDALHACLHQVLPEGPHYFDKDQVTDRPTKFLCAEILREKVFRLCGQELPYGVTVDIESFKEDEAGVAHIHALVLVEKESHKRMIIGEHGTKLKTIASAARLDMEKLLDQKVFLKTWCKVKSGWSDDERLLKQLGYGH